MSLTTTLHAEVMIESVSWQLAGPVRGQKPVFATIKSLPTAPPRIKGRLRLRVVLKNRGPKPAEGLLLRYSLSARLLPAGGGAEGVWAVAFLINEKRVPKVKPNNFLDVAIDPSQGVDMPLTHYLKKTLASGFWPDQIKLQLMLSPRRGAVDEVKTVELILPVEGS
ncbi:MAG: hypothetical protein PHU21_09525 [Elusimicrobia bacterium]|jgi:hypothetical protein|nr:hypothetical protein [Elusimicrobiota bacterium]